MGRMVHVPINHPLQPLYRLLGGLVGAYLIAFGVFGAVRARGLPAFAQEGLPRVLGLHTNLAFSVLSIVVGLVVLVAALIGRNVAQRVNLFGSVVFLAAGLLMLPLIRSPFNFLGFTPATSAVSFVIGLTLLLAGLYGKVGSLLETRREEDFRHGQGTDPSPHRWHGPNPPSDWQPEPRDWRRDQKHLRSADVERGPGGTRAGETSGPDQVGVSGSYE